MAKAPMYKGKTYDGSTVVGKLLIEDKTYYIANDDVGIKKEIKLKSLSIATKKEYSNFVQSFK